MSEIRIRRMRDGKQGKKKERESEQVFVGIELKGVFTLWAADSSSTPSPITTYVHFFPYLFTNF